MSVILAREYDFQEIGYGERHTQPCFNCGGACHYPFVDWDGASGAKLSICSACCAQIKSGLMADFARVASLVFEASIRNDVLRCRKCKQPKVGVEQ
jgi:hypothetical protein